MFSLTGATRPPVRSRRAPHAAAPLLSRVRAYAFLLGLARGTTEDETDLRQPLLQSSAAEMEADELSPPMSPPVDSEEGGVAASSAAPSEAISEADGFDPGMQVMSLLKPVCVTMVIVVYLVHTLQEVSRNMQSGFSELMVYHENDTDSSATKVGGVLLNALVVVGTLFVVTTGLLALYKCRCYAVIYAWLFFSVGSLLFIFGGYVGETLFEVYQLPLDLPTGVFALYNFSAVGTLLVFWTEFGCGPRPPLELQQAYLVVVSALMAWSGTKLPEWTTWSLLLAVALWDIVAVLTPRGPLRMLVEEAERRNEPIPGDFIFYSLLVGRASMHGVATLVASAVAVLGGLVATLALLPIMQRVLPALPMSIGAAAALYYVVDSCVVPLARFAANNSLVL